MLVNMNKSKIKLLIASSKLQNRYNFKNRGGGIKIIIIYIFNKIFTFIATSLC